MAPGRSGEARCSAALHTGLGSAVPDVVAEALAGLQGQQPSLAIVEVSAPGDPNAGGRALAHAGHLIREVAPTCAVIGSTAHGVIGPNTSVEMEPAISVWLAALPGEAPRAYRVATVPAPNGGVALTGLPDITGDDRLALLLADPWSLPLDDVVAAFARVDGPVPIVGGVVSGAAQRGGARLMLDGAVFDNGGVGIVLGADAPVRAIVSQGCRPIGEAMAVTDAHGQAIITLAGRPALERVREVVENLDAEDQALAVRGLHVGIAHAGADGDSAADYVVRGLLGIDPGSGAIAVGDEVAIGSVVRLHLRDADSADADLRTVAATIGPGPAGAYLFTCNGRGGAMFTSSDHDASVLRTSLRTSSIGGFFAAGEIGPIGGENHLHGFTAVVLVVDPVTDVGGVEVLRNDRPEGVGGGDLDAELRALLGP